MHNQWLRRRLIPRLPCSRRNKQRYDQRLKQVRQPGVAGPVRETSRIVT